MTYENDVRHSMAAAAQKQAHPRPKWTAAMLGRSVRTVQRYRSPEYTAGSPIDRALETTAVADDPWIIVSHIQIAAERKSVRHKTTEELIDRYIVLLGLDSLQEGRDNAMKVDRNASWEERAKCSARDAAHDLEKAAIEQELMVRRVPPAEVFGGPS